MKLPIHFIVPRALCLPLFSLSPTQPPPRTFLLMQDSSTTRPNSSSLDTFSDRPLLCLFIVCDRRRLRKKANHVRGRVLGADYTCIKNGAFLCATEGLIWRTAKRTPIPWQNVVTKRLFVSDQNFVATPPILSHTTNAAFLGSLNPQPTQLQSR